MAEGHRQRMRERFYNEGIDSFEPHEVLEMILYFTIPRKDTNKIAHDLIKHFGSFHGVLEANREDLIEFGLTENTAALINMLPSFFNFYTKSRVHGTTILPDTTAMGNFAVNMVGTRTNEIFAVICLDMQKKLIKYEIVAEGTVNQASISPRKVAEAVLRNKAAQIVLVHNHPGGSLSPSEKDIFLTNELVKMCDSISVRVLDHIIVANGRFSSMLERNMI